MKLFHVSKDGGKDSHVTGYWLIEWKSVFSIVLLRFDKGSREVFHNHAFHAFSWILSGELLEETKEEKIKLLPSFLPFITSRERLHKVYGIADKTWALSFRGPWKSKWNEWDNKTNKTTTLTHGRILVNE